MPAGRIQVLVLAILATTTVPSHGESTPKTGAPETRAPKAGTLADLCPSVDVRDTIDSVRSRVAARLGDPIKEEEIDTQYVLTYRQQDGSQLFVILTRDDDRLEVNCYASKS